MHALRQEVLPPTGVEFATCLRLTPQPSTTHDILPRAIANLVVARANLLRIYEIREEPTAFSPRAEDERDRKAAVRRGTEAVEGEVEMDSGGDGFINIGKQGPVHYPTVTRLYLVREHRLHGIVTGMQSVRTVHSQDDGLDRLLVSFKDAKIALLEWSESTADLATVSIHTYERAPQLLSLDSSLFRAQLRVDPLSRCVALSLPKHALAILPFYQSQAELDVMDQDLDDLHPNTTTTSTIRDIPYSPSFILDLPAQVDTNLRNVIDFVFLPGFHNPTIAVLFQTQLTWTGRLKEFKDTTKLALFTLDIASQTYPVISLVENLPHDALSLTPAPPSLGGGVVLLCSNAIIYIDQSSRRVVLPVNGWLERISDVMGGVNLASSSRGAGGIKEEPSLLLEGARIVFMDDEKSFLLVLKDGIVYRVEMELDGKVVSRMIISSALARCTIPSVVCALGSRMGARAASASTSAMKTPNGQTLTGGEDLYFIGSTAGPSVLFKAIKTEVEEEEEDVEMGNDISNAAATTTIGTVTNDDDIDYGDDDDDIYGSSTSPSLAQTASNSLTSPNAPPPKKTKTRTVIQLSLRDALNGYGPIGDMTFSLTRNGDRPVPELVTTTGVGHLGGFTVFQRDLPILVKRKLHAIGGARGLWALPIRHPSHRFGSGGAGGTGGTGVGAGGGQQQQEVYDTLVLSTDVNPSPGLSRIAMRASKGDISITTRIPGTTVGAAPFFNKTAILHVMTNSIRVLEADGSERQIIKDMDGNMPRPKIRACSISDPFVLIFREDDSIGLFIGEPERAKIRRKDMSPMGDKTSRYLAGCFFTDTTGLFDAQFRNSGPSLNTTATVQSVVNAGAAKSQWLLLVRPQGVMEIWTLPKLTLAFSTEGLATLQNTLVDSHDPPALSLPQDPPRKPQDLDVEQILLAPIGETAPRPHLCVFLRCGQLTVYELNALSQTPVGSAPSGVVDKKKEKDAEADTPPTPRATHLSILFNKVSSIAFEIHRQEESTEKSIIAEQKRVMRHFVPFVTTPNASASSSQQQQQQQQQTYTGVFLTGDRPNWILATNQGGLQIVPSGHGVVHAFTTCSLWEARGDFLLYTEEGPTLLEWIPDFKFWTPLPSRFIPRGRAYSNVLFEPNTSLIVAASSLQAKFASYDEDGNRIWEPDLPNVSDPVCDCSSLELISPDVWMTLDGYEFANNEFVNDMAIVTLETAGTENGTKDFIAVGTTIDRGEDLAARGVTYIFEIVEVVSDPALAPQRWYKLRLRCRDDAKGPVTAVCGFSGYLVSSMGQKVFVRAFDSDERLVGVAFLDVGVYVTSLRTLKNLLLVGDAVKSVMFVAFQEDPYKLLPLAKDTKQIWLNCADFFFTDTELSIVTGDEEGILRIYEYNPHDPDSNDGRHLLLRTEFHGQADYRTTLTIARRRKDKPDIPESRILMGFPDGSLYSLTPIDEDAYKRLQLLQGQLTRNIQHVAGLNPKAFRIVRNDYVSRPLTKGILDGNLLAQYEALPITRQNEMTRQIGTERMTVLRDWIALSGAW